MATMRVAQVSRPKGPFEIVERPIPEPGPGTVRIKVRACGICHSDSLIKEGAFPGFQYPRVPGHEVAGVIDAVGAGRRRLGAGPERGRRLERRLLRPLRPLPPRRFLRLRDAGRSPASRSDGGYARIHDRARQRGGADAGGPAARRGGPADVRRAHHVQRPAQQRRAAGRRRGRPRAWRSGPPWRPVRREDGLSHRRHRPRQGQGTAGPPARRVGLHRQPGPRPRGRTQQAGRRQSHPGHGDQRRGDERRPGRPGGQRHAADRRRGRVDAGVAAGCCSRATVRSRAGTPAPRSTRRTRSPSAREPACGR